MLNDGFISAGEPNSCVRARLRTDCRTRTCQLADCTTAGHRQYHPSNGRESSLLLLRFLPALRCRCPRRLRLHHHIHRSGHFGHVPQNSCHRHSDSSSFSFSIMNPSCGSKRNRSSSMVDLGPAKHHIILAAASGVPFSL